MSKDLNWAVLGTGVIANEMAAGLQKMGKTLYAVGNRTYSKAVAFAEKYGIKKVYTTIDEMFVDDNVDIIYITSPHNTHYGFMKKALENSKHLLVEKSITLNSQELDEMVALAESKGLILAEAMTIWHMPLYKELWRIVQSGELGRVQMITVNFGSFKEYNMENRFFNRNLAGGAMLDIGVYALSIVRSFMDEAPAKCTEPVETGTDRSGRTGNDPAPERYRPNGNSGTYHALQTAEARHDQLRESLHRDHGIPARRQGSDHRCSHRGAQRGRRGRISECALL